MFSLCCGDRNGSITDATVITKEPSSNVSVSARICLAIAGLKKELGSNIPEAESVVFPELQAPTQLTNQTNGKFNNWIKNSS